MKPNSQKKQKWVAAGFGQAVQISTTMAAKIRPVHTMIPIIYSMIK